MPNYFLPAQQKYSLACVCLIEGGKMVRDLPPLSLASSNTSMYL
jgi:hypothetical protein